MQEAPTDDPFDYFGLESDPAHWQASCPELVIKSTVQGWEEQRAWSSDFVCILSIAQAADESGGPVEGRRTPREARPSAK